MKSKQVLALVLCVLSSSGAIWVARAQKSSSSNSAAIGMSAFKLDDFFKSRGFVAEKAPGQNYGMLSADRHPQIPAVNQRWFHGNDRIEFSVLTFKSEKEARQFDKDFLAGHQLTPISPFSCPVVDGVRDNTRNRRKFKAIHDGSNFTYNFLVVGRTYMVIEAIQWPKRTPKSLSPQEFARVVQGVKQKLIAAAKTIPQP